MSATLLIADDLVSHYARSLSDYLRSGGESALLDAYELGRSVLAGSHGVLDMVTLHHAALTKIVREDATDGAPAETITRAGEFLTESMSPFEMTHRAFGEANAALRRLNDTLEEQVRHIALALHDDTGQLMVAAQMRLDAAARELPSDVRGKLSDVKALLNGVDERIRHLSHELHPAMLEHLGLVSAVEFLAANFAQRAGLRVSVKSSLHGRLSPRIATPFYRIVQEALTNVRRHAQASTIRIRFSNHGPEVRCTVADNGIGFDVDDGFRSGLPGLGLLGIRERLSVLGGKLSIRSAAGRGTKLEITAPLQEGDYADTSTPRG